MGRSVLLLAGGVLASGAPQAAIPAPGLLHTAHSALSQPARPGSASPSGESRRQPAAMPAPFRWTEAPLTLGGWSYQAGGGVSRARFGRPNAAVFQIQCPVRGTILLSRAGSGGTAMTIRTSLAVRTLGAAGAADGLTARLSAADPLLDAVAFSRGRFAVEVPGAAPLVIPAWPPFARVVEDCRR